MFYKIKFAFRGLIKNRLYSIINIVGLTIGLTACFFIMLWVMDEKSYDRFHENADEIYMGVAHFTDSDFMNNEEVTTGLFAPAAKENFTTVKDYCRIRSDKTGYILAEGKSTDEKSFLVADSTFFTFFNFPVLTGSPQDLLRKPDEVVISESLATEMFGSDNPRGKMITIKGISESFKEIEKHYFIAAVMQDLPANTSLPRADMVIPQKSDPYSLYMDIWNGWGGCEFLSFIRVSKGTDIEQLAKDITNLQTRSRDSRHFTLQPLVNRHLYNLDGSPAGIKTVWIFIWIACAIIIISCINYVNLVTGRSAKRNHEVGIKKILGARKLALFFQMITESILLFLITIVIAVFLNFLLIDVFNIVSGKEINLAWNNLNIWMLYGFMFVVVIVLAGIYPAFSVSSFKLLHMLTGRLTNKGHISFQKLLIVGQFIASIVLIAATITLESQLTYLRRKNLGYNQEQVFTCRTRDMAAHYQTVKTELMRNPAILSVDGAGYKLSEVYATNTTSNWEGKEGDGFVSYYRLYIDSTFFSNMNMEFASGSGFLPGAKDFEPWTDAIHENENQFVINESAVRSMGLTEPVVGKWMEADRSRGRIVGVVKDFHFNSFLQEIAPLVLFYSSDYANTLYIRTTAQDAGRAIAAVEKIWKAYNPSYTFSYSFMDESFEQLYSSYIRTGLLFGIFSFTAILISCLGLFGLVTYKAEAKTREIGIRKVFGAGVSDIVTLLIKEFMILVGIAILIAFPLAYYWLDSLLQDFAYRISIGWWIFAVSGVIAIIITLLTVGWKAIKVASTNPVEAIKVSD